MVNHGASSFPSLVEGSARVRPPSSHEHQRLVLAWEARFIECCFDLAIQLQALLQRLFAAPVAVSEPGANSRTSCPCRSASDAAATAASKVDSFVSTLSAWSIVAHAPSSGGANNFVDYLAHEASFIDRDNEVVLLKFPSSG
jgi:hypothetical protein